MARSAPDKSAGTGDLFDLPDASPVVGVPAEVCALFSEIALKIIAQGWSHYSARAILHRIRWHMHIEKGDRSFKCNNNWTPRLSRWWLQAHPEHAGFFETRTSPGTVPGSGDED